MKLLWTQTATYDLERITDYLVVQSPERAARLVRTIYQAPASLIDFPSEDDPARNAAHANSRSRPSRG